MLALLWFDVFVNLFAKDKKGSAEAMDICLTFDFLYVFFFSKYISEIFCQNV